MRRRRLSPVLLVTAAACACAPAGGPTAPDGRTRVTISASTVGLEADTLREQIERFEASHPRIAVEIRATPDSADQRGPLYVQWLAAGSADPDVLQIDVVWTASYAAAGWLLALDRFSPDTRDYLEAPLAAARWDHSLRGLPWFVDVGMLYWRTDLMERAPRTLSELDAIARRALGRGDVDFGFVWQGARYEGLVCVFLEVLGAYGGSILDERGRVAVDSDAAVRALDWLAGSLDAGISPRDVLGWQEDPVRLAFQSGRAAFMRNWPYAFALLEDERESNVAGRFDVAPMPAAEGGAPTATLGGQLLAINAASDVPDAAFELISFLTSAEECLQRARRAGQLPPRRSSYRDARLDEVLPLPAATLGAIVERAVPRPASPVYTEMSRALQARLHEALSGQADPREALAAAAREMREVLDDAGLR